MNSSRAKTRINQEQLSQELLEKISLDSLSVYRPSDDRSAWVSRTLGSEIARDDERDVLFVIAESGLGKSVACYKRVEQHVSAGGFGLILPHQTIADALTIEEAIDKALRQLHPNLTPETEFDAPPLCSGSWPLLVVVEDINKSGQAQYLAEKLAKWGSRVKENNKTSDQSPPRTDRENWRLLCPLWPQVVASLGRQILANRFSA